MSTTLLVGRDHVFATFDLRFVLRLDSCVLLEYVLVWKHHDRGPNQFAKKQAYFAFLHDASRAWH